MNRIDAWFTGVPEGQYIWNKYILEPQRLYMSPVLASFYLYLACSKDCDPEIVKDLRLATKSLDQKQP